MPHIRFPREFEIRRWCPSLVWAAMVLCYALNLNAFETDANRFEKFILPILKTHCFDCHSGDTEEGGVQFNL